jgi:sugar lactone lactonase YvrE
MNRRGLLAAFAGLLGLAIVGFALQGPAATGTAAIPGTRPSYAPAALSVVPNDAATTRRIWMPGLDGWYNAQGLAVTGDSILVAAYRSESPELHRGPCRVFRVEMATGGVSGQLDVPPPCGHAGGLATAGRRKLYVADTHTLFATGLDSAFAAAARFAMHPLGPGLVGALAISGEDAIWLGSYREDGPGRLYRFAAAALEAMPDGAALNASEATFQIAIPSYAQGAAIDTAGHLWVARSTLRWGELDRLDAATGQIEHEYPAPPGLEGIAFDDAGRLWAVSEAGARHYYSDWRALVLPFFPLIFALDPERLN